MAPLGLYASLATTAGVFVGLLNAYLVSRISELKGERRRLEQRVKAIDARLESLFSHREWRGEQISEQSERRAREQAQDDVDRFIRQHVGDEWSPNPDDLTFEDALDAFAASLGQEKSELSYYHVDEIRSRWRDILEELSSSPDGPFGGIAPNALDSSTRAIHNQIESQWEIYDRTLLDRRSADFASVTTEIESLKEERERLVRQYTEADPTELVHGVKSTGWAIGLSVGIPMVYYLFHAIEWTFPIPFGSVVEPLLVFTSWSIGLILTFQYVRNEVAEVENNLPEPPSESGEENEVNPQTQEEERELEETD